MPHNRISLMAVVTLGLVCLGAGPVARAATSGGHDLSAGTAAVLESRGWIGEFRHHPDRVAETLREAVESGRDPGALLALSEVCYREGQRIEWLHPGLALVWYRDGAAYAAFALDGSVPADRVLAERLHDLSVERIVHVVSPSLCGGRPWAERLAEAGIAANSDRVYLRPDRVDSIRVAADLRVRGMNSYHTREGLGVPVVTLRTVDHDAPRDPQDTFYGRELILPATAIVRPAGALQGGQWRTQPVVLDLRDSFNDETVSLGHEVFPLAGNFTAPTAYQANRSAIRNLGVLGTFNPVKARELAGVVMPRPYEPGKIPVVFIHGLASGPSTWLTAYNDLLGDPQIRERYQLWAVRYPPGEPILVSANVVRQVIRDACQTLDSTGADPSMRGMIVIGHSIGGILTKSLITETGDSLWRAWFTRPLDLVVASPAIRQRLIEFFFLRPEPRIVRAVMIATPLRGSPGAVSLPGRISSLLVRPDDLFIPIRDQLIADNGREVFQPYFQPRRLNGISGLDPESPTLEALRESPIAPGVPYHTIIAFKNHGEEIPLEKLTDGYVRYTSAHIDGAQSEVLVRSGHSCLDKPETSAEVRRILHVHLRDVDRRKVALRTR